ncbi:RPC7L-like protein, partial [Mya arenaria]
VFQNQEFKPVPLVEDEDMQYIVALKQEFVGSLRKSKYFLTLGEKKKDIERYTDKYQLNQQDSGETFTPDWNRFPAELKVRERKVKKLRTSAVPNIPQRKKESVKVKEEDIAKALENLEKDEAQVDEAEEGGEAEEKKKEGEDDEDEANLEDELEYDEDDLEEETDYAVSYFDNGEGYGDDDGDDDEGPVY